MNKRTLGQVVCGTGVLLIAASLPFDALYYKKPEAPPQVAELLRLEKELTETNLQYFAAHPERTDLLRDTQTYQTLFSEEYVQTQRLQYDAEVNRINWPTISIFVSGLLACWVGKLLVQEELEKKVIQS